MGRLREQLSKIMHANESCNFHLAYDLAITANASYPDSLAAKFHAVYALTHIGLAAQAWELHEKWKLGETAAQDRAALAGTVALYRAHSDVDLAKIEIWDIPKTANLFTAAYDEVSSIGACIIRQRSWDALTLESRVGQQSRASSDYKRFARKAAGMFVRTYEETREVLSGINAAVMYLLAGDENTARFTASRVIPATETPNEPLILTVARAINDLLTKDFGAFKTRLVTIKSDRGRSMQLARAAVIWRLIGSVCHECINNAERESQRTGDEMLKGRYEDALRLIEKPSLIHYGGHMISEGRFPATQVDSVRGQIRVWLERHDVRAGYGGLACGADILFAEELIERKAELHVVLPFRVEDFKDSSVRRGGIEWLGRFDECLKAASSVTYVTEDEHLGDDALFALGSDVAIGMAITRHKVTDHPLKQVLVWDGKAMPGRAGTVSLRQRWIAGKQDETESFTIPSLPPETSVPADSSAVVQPTGVSNSVATSTTSQVGRRDVKALLFGDVKGFSTLQEDLIPKFWDVVILGITETLNAFQIECGKGDDDRPVNYWNTWGDAVYIVVRSVQEGAECALRLQERIKRIDFAAHGLPSNLSMRFGCHVGPVYENIDPITKQKTWHGSHVSRAARIEPITEPGEIFVSEPFAQVLALEAYSHYDCEYLGVRPAAKKYGEFRMYRLKRRLDDSGMESRPSCPAKLPGVGPDVPVEDRS